jgi:hypothetical protein
LHWLLQGFQHVPYMVYVYVQKHLFGTLGPLELKHVRLQSYKSIY